MNNFIPGQRWISDAEPQLGLGTILSVEHRTVSVHFLSTEDIRTYARQNAPLSRVAFSAGDKIKSHEGWQLTVESVEETDGLLTYYGPNEQGEFSQLPEAHLDHAIQLNRPAERLMAGQIDNSQWFGLRYQSWQQLNRLAHSELYGLLGARTSLIPHQLYIAHEVANRYAPRVLLADEVGLGKTIEAGLILHHQLLTERARRVLIVVPEALVHQWLVEMLRRFNLYFSIFNEERCAAIEEHSADINPFETEQLVLCHLGFLQDNHQRLKQAVDAGWDLLVVDEAHHLQWSEQESSPEYDTVELLAAHTRGVLLLTATPEQLGKASHFARLRLLDPERFPSYQKFIEEEQYFQPIAELVEQLLSDEPLDTDKLQNLQQSFADPRLNEKIQQLIENDNTDNRHQLVNDLLDRHGTGRVLFRNTRSAIQGFPERHCHPRALPLPDEYATLKTGNIQSQLCPETAYQKNWLAIDPRVDFVIETLKQNHPHKVLIICAHASTALQLAEHLSRKAGIHAGVFHEQLSIVERDKTAAYFADMEDGCQALVCSEIGSEGRNFQFAHQLILFDLPFNPDLLEQRIGRLDRIGQTQSIQIHVPYLQSSAQEVMFNWYHKGLNAFEQTCPAAHNVFVQTREALASALQSPQKNYTALIAHSHQLHQQLDAAMQQGRDRLLEYNSCRPDVSQQLQEDALHHDQHNFIADYMEQVFDAFGVNNEAQSDHRFILSPGNHMLGHFPGLSDDGMTITYKRNLALSHEDIHFLSWEHPMVIHAMDMITSSEMGNTAVSALPYQNLSAGSLLLECLFVLEAPSSENIQTRRYLPPTTIRLLLDEKGRDHHSQLSHAHIHHNETPVDAETASMIIKAKQQECRQMINTAEQQAGQQQKQIIDTAMDNIQQSLQKEINRLESLIKMNPSVRQDEIQYFRKQKKQLEQALQSASLRLDAVKVIVTT